MPRADRGSIAVDISVLEGLSDEKLARLIVLAAEVGAIVVTSPSLVPSWISGRPLRVALGVGSLVFPPRAREELEALGIAGIEMSAPEWVEGCRARALEELPTRWVEGSDRLTGRAVPGDLRDPVALMLAGSSAEGWRPGERSPPLAAVNGEPVAWYDGDTIITTLDKGSEAGRRLILAARILGLCASGDI